MVGNVNGGSGEQHHFAPGDIVLGKIKGYPPWPGVLCHEDNVPKKNVLSSRPGKNYFIVRFFPAADYGFNRSHELRRLTKREIEAFLSDPHKRAADLREAYKLALDPESWNEEQNDAVRQAEEEGDEEEDMLAEEEEDDEEQPVKKRKSLTTSKKSSSSSSSHAAKKQKKESSSSSKAGPNSPQDNPAKGSGSSHTSLTGARQRELSGSPQKATHAGDGDAEEAEMDPETKKVKNWRYSLQHAFLPRSGAINGAEMERYDQIFKQVEQYEGITAAQLRQTKIGKVMKRVVQLVDVPRDDEFHFKRRAQKLCDVWGELIAGTGGLPSAKQESTVADHPSNGKDSNGSVEGVAAKVESSSANSLPKSEVSTIVPPVQMASEPATDKTDGRSDPVTSSNVGDESVLTQINDGNRSVSAS